MAINYVVNAPTSIKWLWFFVKAFLDEHTIKKVKISGDIPLRDIWMHVNPGQLEERFGGTAPNAESFWPPVMPEGKLALLNDDPEMLLSHISSYEEYYPAEIRQEVEAGQLLNEPYEVVEEVQTREIEGMLEERKRSYKKPKVVPVDVVRSTKACYISDSEFNAAFGIESFSKVQAQPVHLSQVSLKEDGIECLVSGEEASAKQICVEVKTLSDEEETASWWRFMCRLKCLR
jgi:hypothetical protein